MSSGLTFNIYGHDVSASKTLKGVQGDADTTAKGISSSFKKAGALIAGAFAVDKVIGFFKGAFDEAEEAQKVGAQTAAVIKSTGSAANVTADQVGNLANSISKKVGVDDEAIQSGENMLLTFTNIRNEVGAGNDVFDQATSILTDMSVAMGTDMKTQAIQLGKALNDPVKGISALARVGVSFTDQQREQIAAMVQTNDTMGAQKVILAELNKEFGGAAEAQATPADKAKVAWGNLKEEIGTELMPVVTSLANFLVDDVVPALSATLHFVKDNASWIGPLAGSVLGLWGAWKGYTIAKTAVTALRTNLALLRADLVKTKEASVGAAASSSQFIANFGKGLGIVGAVTLAFYGLGRAISSITDGDDQKVIDELNNIKQTVADLRGELEVTAGALNDAAWSKVAHDLQDSGLADKAAAAGISLAELTDAVTGSDEAFGSLIDRWRAAGAPSDNTLMRINLLHGAFNKAAGEARDLSDATNTNSEAQGRAAGALDKTTGKMNDQTTAADKLMAAIKKLSGDKIGAAQAELQFRDGLAAATQQVKDNGSSLTENTAKGRANREWLLDQITSLHDVAKAQLDAGEKTSVVTQKLHDNETALRQAADAAGLNRQQVQQLIDRYGALPRNVTTHINADTSGASATVDGFIRHVDSLYGTITINARGAAGSSALAQGTGFWRGPRYAQGSGMALVGEFGPEIAELPFGTKMRTHAASESLMRMGGRPDIDLSPVVGELRAMRRENRELRAAIASIQFTVDGYSLDTTIGKRANRLGRAS